MSAVHILNNGNLFASSCPSSWDHSSFFGKREVAVLKLIFFLSMLRTSWRNQKILYPWKESQYPEKYRSTISPSALTLTIPKTLNLLNLSELNMSWVSSLRCYYLVVLWTWTEFVIRRRFLCTESRLPWGVWEPLWRLDIRIGMKMWKSTRLAIWKLWIYPSAENVLLKCVGSTVSSYHTTTWLVSCPGYRNSGRQTSSSEWCCVWVAGRERLLLYSSRPSRPQRLRGIVNLFYNSKTKDRPWRPLGSSTLASGRDVWKRRRGSG